MASFLEMLAQNQPHFQTRKALIITGLQNDFVSPTIGFVNEMQPDGFLDRIKELVPHFRQSGGDIVWARTEYTGDVSVNDPSELDGERVIYSVEDILNDVAIESDSDDPDENEDIDGALEVDTDPSPPASPTHPPPPGMTRSREMLETLRQRRAKSRTPDESQRVPPTQQEEDREELFLDQSNRIRPFCVAGTWGAEFEDSFKPYIDESQDILVTKPKYSAFSDTSLLLTLRTKLVTEIYVCGVLTNMSVYATAMDAARHGFHINILEDCVGYRHRPLHEESIRQMQDLMGATMVNSLELHQPQESASEYDSVRLNKDRDSIEGALESLTLGESLPNSDTTDDSSSTNAEDGSPMRSTEKRQKHLVRRSGRNRNRIETSNANVQQENGVSAAPPNRMYKKPRFRGHERQMLRDENQKVDERIDGAIAKLNDHLYSGAKLIEDARKTVRLTDRDSFPEKHRQTESLEATNDTQLATRARLINAAKNKRELLSAADTSTQEMKDLSPEDRIGEDDSHIIYNFFGPAQQSSELHGTNEVNGIFQQLYDEVRWQRMFHQQGEVPRLVAVQGEIDQDGSEPTYRHPTDQALPTMRFTSTVQRIREQVEKTLNHPVNHVLIQLYRSGADYISEHSDKTLDIVHGSSIANASLGAQRTMRLRLKKSALSTEMLEQYERDPAEARHTQRIPMPHNSLFILGPKTNARWLHGINRDRRPSITRSAAEEAYGGMRISLTFRQIGTFISPDQRIWGQGATRKTKETGLPVINNLANESDNLVSAFGKENHESAKFNWTETYGKGSDVLHLREPPNEIPTLFLSGDNVQDLRVKLWLEEVGINHATVDAQPELERPFASKNRRKRSVLYRDADPRHTEIEGAMQILSQLQYASEEDQAVANHVPDNAKDKETGVPLTRQASPLFESLDIYTLWQHHLETQLPPSTDSQPLTHPLYFALKRREDALETYGFLGGKTFGIADCAVWPVVKEIRDTLEQQRGAEDGGVNSLDRQFPRLWAWFGRIEGRGSTKRALAGI